MNLETSSISTNNISRNDEYFFIWFFAILYLTYKNKLTLLKIEKGIPINDGTVIHANIVEILTNIWHHMDIQCVLCGIQSVLFNVSGARELISTLGKEYLLIFGQHPNNFAKLTLLKRTAIQHNMPDFLSKFLLLSINLYRFKIDLLKRIDESAKTVTSCSSIEDIDIALKDCMAKIESITTIPTKTVKVKVKKRPNVGITEVASIDNKRGRALDATLIMAAEMTAEIATEVASIDNKRGRTLDATLIMTAEMATEVASIDNKRGRALDATRIMTEIIKVASPEAMDTSSAIDNKRARALSAVHSITEQNLCRKQDCEVNVFPLFINSLKAGDLCIDTV